MPDNALAAFRGAGLPSREQVGQFLNSAAMAVPTGGGKQFLKISDKDGVWSYGAEETVVEDDALWAVNPLSFFHGYIAWFDGKPEGEHRQPISKPLPPASTFGETKSPKGWETLFGFDLVCVSGEDEGTLCEYKASSVGGTRAVGTLVNEINRQYTIDPDRILPVVQLRDNKYYDKKYKKDQFPPVFQIVEWRSMTDDAPVEKPEPEPEQPPTRTRTRAAAAPAQTPPEESDEEAELQREYEAEQQKAAAAPPDQAPRRRLRR